MSIVGIGKTATKIFTDATHKCVQYHNTIVAKWTEQEIILNTGGYYTNTTKRRMNEASKAFGLNINVFQKKGDWFVDYNGKTLNFKDNMVLAR